MRNHYKLLLSFALTFVSVIAPSLTGRAGGGSLSAQTIGDAFYIYRNDGNFNAFFREEIDSITYSCYDLDSLLHEDVVTQVVFTEDSVYRIPLAAIDSISFVQPETIYRENAVPLSGNLFDYLIDVNGYTLTFDITLPSDLTPRYGDKLVTTDITDKLPFGFVGLVQQVTSSYAGIEVVCDSIGLEDAVSQFYGVIELGVGSDGEVKPLVPQKARTTTTRDYGLPFGRTTLPTMDLSIFIREKNIFDINSKNSLDISFTPQVAVKITRVVDDVRFLSHTNVRVTTDVDATAVWDVAGEASKEWSRSYLPKQEYPMPFLGGYPLYFDIGGRFSINGEIVAGFTINTSARQITDITLYDVSLIPFVGVTIGTIINHVEGSIAITNFDMDWSYLGVRAGLTLTPIYMRVGLPVGTHEVAWVGGDFDAGLKANAELMFDLRRIQNAEPGTAVYDELKDIAKLDIKPYIGAHFVAAAADDRYKFSLGKEFEHPQWTWYQGRPLPEFSNTVATPLSDTKAKVKANITNDCPIPYTVGFAIYDENGNRAADPVYYGEKFWTRHAFRDYTCEFDGLEKGKKYKVYPVIRWFGKYDMLCSPSADLDTDFPVELSDFKVTKSQYKEDGFTHDGQNYDYRFDVSVTATLDAEDTSNITDWGYAYLDPNGREALISLRQFGTSYTDTRYAYFRNQAHATCTLYGYVKYAGSNEPVYGEPHDYELNHSETSCPDSNHPHWIDLGLPSGTQWRCCNEGASTPEAYGGYYTFGQVSSAPTLDQIKELLYYTTSVWTTQNGVNGRKFTGPNGGTIFLPAAGRRWNGEFSVVGTYGGFWSSTPYDESSACGLYFYSGYADWYNFWGRDGGHSVRPVR